MNELKLDHFKDLHDLKINVNNWIQDSDVFAYERFFSIYDLKQLVDYIYELKKDKICACYVDSLEKENKQLKEIIEKAKKLVEEHITFCKNDSQGVHEICNLSIRHEEEVLDILNGDNK